MGREWHATHESATETLQWGNPQTTDKLSLPMVGHSFTLEFVFRFNRRRSRSRGMVFYRVLELAVAHELMRYQDLIVQPTAEEGATLAAQTAEAIPRAWSARGRTGRGGRLNARLRTSRTPVKWIPPSGNSGSVESRVARGAGRVRVCEATLRHHEGELRRLDSLTSRSQ